MRLSTIVAFAGLFAVSAAAHADTYSLSFISSSSEVQVGTGSLSFDGPSPTGYSGDYTTVPLTDINITLDGQSFNSSNLYEPAEVVFYDGSISDYVLYLSNAVAGLSTISQVYLFGDGDLKDVGVIESTLLPAAPGIAPEPSGIALLSTGLLGVAGLVRKRVHA